MDLLREKSHRDDQLLDVRPTSPATPARDDHEPREVDDGAQARMWQRIDEAPQRAGVAGPEQAAPQVAKIEQQAARIEQQAAKVEQGQGDAVDDDAAADDAAELEVAAAGDPSGEVVPDAEPAQEQAKVGDAKLASSAVDPAPNAPAPEANVAANVAENVTANGPVEANTANANAPDGSATAPEAKQAAAKTATGDAKLQGNASTADKPGVTTPDKATPGALSKDAAHEQMHARAGKVDGVGVPGDARLVEADPRGDARPQVHEHTAAIEQVALASDERDVDAAPAPAPKLGGGASSAPLPADLQDEAQLDAVVAQRRGAIEADAGQRESEADAKAETQRKAVKADQKRQAVQAHGQRAAGVQRDSLTKAKARKAVTKDELRTKLTTGADAEKAKLEGSLATKRAELDTKLQKRMRELLDEQKKKQDERLLKELDKRVVKLEKGIADRKAAHDKQIAKEKVALEKQDAEAQAKLRATAKDEADKIKDEARAQADATQRQAEQRAADTATSGETEARAAVSTGETKAQQAIAAAEARAKSLGEDEAAKVRSEGQSRAKMARSTAASRAGSIRTKGKLDAAKLRATGKSDRSAQIAKGDARAAKAIANGEAQAAKVHKKTLEQIAAMQAKSDAAVKAMEDEVAKMKAEVEQKRTEIKTKAATAAAEVQAKIDDEKTKALEAIEQENAKTIAKIDAKVAEDLAKIDAASEKDLARLEQTIDRDLKEIERAVKRAEQTIDQKIRAADRKVAATVAQKKAQIRAETTRLVCSLDRMAAQTRQRIRAADKNTSKDIKAAQTAGLAAIEAASQQAETDLSTANGKLLQETTEEGNRDRAAIDKLAAKSMADMQTQRKDLAKDINKEWVDDAVKKANKNLDDNGIFNVVTDGEAVEAMNILNSLPDEVQGDAVKQLDKDAFGNLLDEVPKERREEFKSLVDNTSDPERKLDLFGEYHKSMAHNNAKRKDDDFLEDIADETDDEIDEEVKFLKTAKKGHLTKEMVEHLMRRKTLEHDIESRHRVNLTNERGVRKEGANKGRKIVWTEEELRELDKTLNKLPDKHVRNNTKFYEIRREDHGEKEKDPDNPSLYADHKDGRIRVYDKGADLGPDSLNEETDGTKPSVLETTVVHELGHNIHDQKDDAFKEFKKTAWEEDLDTDDLEARGLTEDEIERMKKDGHGEAIEKNGKVYTYRYGKFQAVDKEAFPSGDKWDFARNNPKDHFAEMYMMANVTPNQFRDEMITQPTAAVQSEQAVLDAKIAHRRQVNTELGNLQLQQPPASPADLKQKEDELAAAKKAVTEHEAELAKLKKVQAAQAEQYQIMRDIIDGKK